MRSDWCSIDEWLNFVQVLSRVVCAALQLKLAIMPARHSRTSEPFTRERSSMIVYIEILITSATWSRSATNMQFEYSSEK